MGTAAAQPRAAAVGALALLLASAAFPARAGTLDGTLPDGLPELPVLHEAAARGEGIVTPLAPSAPSAKTVDGLIDDWQGTPTGFGGTTTLSGGELIYTDHLFDAYGADDGRDAERLARFEALSGPVPETYRLEPVFTSDLAGELGLPEVEVLAADDRYGNADRLDVADLLEVRVAATTSALHLLARTTTMHTPADTVVLALLDTVPGTKARAVPFRTGLTTTTGDLAVLLSEGRSEIVDLETGARSPITAAIDASGYSNAIEAVIPASAIGRPAGMGSAPLRLAVASGARDAGDGWFADLPDLDVNVANVAFRQEPVTTWFEQRQALALHAGSIDDFAIEVAPSELAKGASQSWTPGPGYHDRIFRSSEAISAEAGTEGIHQHYGVHVPAAYDPSRATTMTMWLHWRGGAAHSAATVAPRILRDQGEAFDGIVLAPRGRGSSTWYLGKGHVDINEVWADALERFNIDQDRVYVSGHSMGGWGSYLLSILYPDRFAAAFPVAGPVTQGAWTGLDFDGCDDLSYEEYTPCYIATNESDPRTQHTRRLLGNLRNVPVAIFQGGADELVPTTGVTRQVERLVELGYRHRYYVFPSYEHYSHPIVDEWLEGARYVHGFVRDPDPSRVTYVRDMPFERTVETGPSQERPVAGLSFDFDRAYWMSELTPADPTDGVATFDGTSFGRGAAAPVLVPEAGGPASVGQVGPYAMTGLGWVANPLEPAAARNAFDLELTGATAVRLDLPRMGLTPLAPMTATVTTEHPLQLRLGAPWAQPVRVRIDGGLLAVSEPQQGVLTITVPAGSHELVIE
jgi:dienelactone hydrolase